MSAVLLLIDGYNLLYAAGWGRDTYGPGDLQRARERLLRHLQKTLQPDEQSRTLVVFDARRPPPDLSRDQQFGDIRIRYASPEGEADPVIESLIAAHSAPKRLTVVSADHRLQKAAKRRGATPLDSDRFLDRLHHRAVNSRPAVPEENQSDHPLSAAEVEAWLLEFRISSPQQSAIMTPPPPATTPPGGLRSLESPPTPAATSPGATVEFRASGASTLPSRRASRTPAPRRSRNPQTPPRDAAHQQAAVPDFTPEWIAELQRWADRLSQGLSDDTA